MFSRKLLAMFLTAALALPVASMSADKPITKSESAQVKATVVAVDQATRLVTLKGPDGKTFEVQAGSAVQHLDQVKPGDVVSVTYTESLAFQVAPKGEAPQGVSGSAQRVAGGAEVGRQATSYFTIDAYDPDTHVLWGTTASGITKSVTVQDPKAQARLKTLNPGTVVQVTYSESLAIRLEKGLDEVVAAQRVCAKGRLRSGASLRARGLVGRTLAIRRAPESRRFPQHQPPPPAPPVAAVRPFTVESPNGNRVDNYYWLRDDTRRNADVLAYLTAENAYTDAMLAHVKPLEDKLFREFVDRIRQDDSSVPYRRARLVVLHPLRHRTGVPGLRTQERVIEGARAGHAGRATAREGA